MPLGPVLSNPSQRRGLTSPKMGVSLPQSPNVINLNTAYGLEPGGDATAALEKGIAKLATIGGGTLYFAKPGEYLLSGAQKTGTVEGSTYSGQVLFPERKFSERSLTIAIQGPIPQFGSGEWGDESSGVVLKSNATSGNIFDVIPAKTELLGRPGSNITVMFQDLQVWAPTNPQCGGIALTRVARCVLENVVIGVASTTNSLTGAGVGLALPEVSNDGVVVLRNVCIEQYPVGCTVTEHGQFMGLWVNECNVGLEGVGGGHANQFGYVDIENCLTFLKGTIYPTYITGFLDIQAQTAGIGAPQLFIDDENNTWDGELAFYGVGALAAGGVPQRGGRSLKVSDLTGQSIPWTATYPADNFVRRWTYNEKGGAPGRAAGTAHPWTVLKGTFSITQKTGFGELKSTEAAGESEALVPVPSPGRSRTTRLSLTTGKAGAFWVMTQIARTFGGAGGGKLEVHFRNDHTFLTLNSTTLKEVAALEAEKAYPNLVAALIYGPNGMAKEAIAYNGVTELFQHTFTEAQAALIISGTDAIAPLMQGITFLSDIHSVITNYEVVPI